ncbi:hypothetical protein ACIHFE_28005 [Streptomyces sp. NPDC052396]|uniref:hypothetical protein n=1 Tax=Streptomyces sp. NPDC052396 TaxID=3365689 RepID=UPI0037D7F375
MRAVRALAAVLALGALAGCGVDRTDAIDFGRPATGVKRPGAPVNQVRLYWAYPGGVFGVSRTTAGRLGAEDAVPLLLAGPSEAERLRGFYSEVPKTGPVSVVTSGDRVLIRMTADPTRFTPNARVQLVCTAAHSAMPGNPPAGEVKVTLSGAGRTLSGETCDKD